nr:protein FAM24A-like isoform X2 [Marmota flaviventris]
MWEGSHSHCLPTLLCPGMFKSFDLRTIIMFAIGSGILAAMLMLIGLVLCLYVKLFKALKAAKECCSNKFQSKGNPPKGITETSPALQCCDECSMYTDYDSLPPCLCGTNEGL